MTGRLKSICKFKEKQVADTSVSKIASATANIKPCSYIGLKNSICNNEYQGSADTTITKRASATANIKPVQIQWLPQRHLYKQINPGYRYIRHQKSKFAGLHSQFLFFSVS